MEKEKIRPDSPLASSVERMRHELDRWMEVARSQGERALDAFGMREGEKTWRPEIDIVESQDDLRVFIDLPGVAPQSIHVTLAGNMLTVKGQRIIAEVDSAENTYLRERPRGEFRRSVPLPLAVDPDDVMAEIDNGVLRVRLGKSERAKAREIQVQVSPRPVPGPGPISPPEPSAG